MKPDADAVTEHCQPPTTAFSGRDESWLRFDERVIEVAEEGARPLFDRLRFLAISASNLDEFFMKRVALLRRRVSAGLERISHDGRSVRQQLEAVCKASKALQDRQAACWHDSIRPELRNAGIKLYDYEDLSERQKRRIDRWFKEQVFPLLTPLAVDPGHPFPFISNLSLNFGVRLVSEDDEQPRFARLKIPDMIPTWIQVPSRAPIESVTDATTPVRVLRMADVIRHNLDTVFPGMQVQDVLEFRVTRSVGLEEEDDDIDDMFEAVEAEMRHRRFAEAVRLETQPGASVDVVNMLLEELELDASCHFICDGPLDYTQLTDLARIDRPDLRSPRWKPVTPPGLRHDGGSIFDVLRKQDLLVHHPYESFRASVERFIAEAADDPDVVAIKQCLYRTDPDSPFIHSLLRAAESGKQVACLVELRARFDERRNLQLTRVLEKHGVHVAWGVAGIKTHAKCSLVVRREGNGFRSYAHIGSGNYHSVTANHYTDVGLLTSNSKVTGDLMQLFNVLTGRSRHESFEQLLVGPATLRTQFEVLIQAEIEHAKAGRPCGIVAKMNQLEDRQMIELLMRASSAGVPIDLLVRGFCCLHPGIAGQSENIRIRSIVGDFLEHARIFHFVNGQADPLDGHWLFGSADWMERNLTSRVEVIVPVEGRANRARLKRTLDVGFLDARNAWAMQHDGSYVRLQPDPLDEPDSVARLGSFDALCRDALSAEVEAIAAGSAKVGTKPIEETPSPKIELPSMDQLLGLVLLDEPWRTRSEIAERAGVSPQLAAGAGSRMEAAGLLVKHTLGRVSLWRPTPMLAVALSGPMVPLDPDRSWHRQWLRQRTIAWVRRLNGETRRSSSGVGLIERRKGEVWTAWGFFDSLQGIRERLQGCLDAEADRIELIAVDRASCQTLRRRVERMAHKDKPIRVRTVAALVAETAPPS